MPTVSKKPNPHVLRTLDIVEWVGLLVISIATVAAIGQEIWEMVLARKVFLQDILLLFIYLEILTMVGLYFKSGKLPLRYPIYIAMVAIARYIIIGMKQLDGWTILAFAGAILVLALAVVAIRYGHVRLPYADD
ncbi:MAG: phosphate-starvation-inducible [Proteobacteria bacterium]|nr:phosphate-starvation-inducible [Pseudomonadota bacterium]